jgi:hypothetical protein
MPGSFGSTIPAPLPPGYVATPFPPPGGYGVVAPLPPPGGYGVVAPLPPAGNGGAPADPRNDPVLSFLDVYTSCPSNDAYVDDPRSLNPSVPSRPVAPVVPPPISASERRPNVNGVSPTAPARIPGHLGPQYVGENDRNVKYIRDVKTMREKYAVEIGASMKRRTFVFETQTIKRQFRQKPTYHLSSAKMGNDRSGNEFQQPNEWIDEALIWVCAPDPATNQPAFYSHVCKGGRFHHSSFVSGGDVIGAGEWIVRGGKLCKISANSGHYLPTIDLLHRSVLNLAAAFQSETKVYLYDRVADKWVDYPIVDFVNNPSNGNRYKTHPDAQPT